MTVKLLTEQHLEFLPLKGGCTGSSESTLVKIPHCWKSHVMALFIISIIFIHQVEMDGGNPWDISEADDNTKKFFGELF